MGKKGKVGKQRRDKFYHLAKETGFRSRSAFKLLQLNRKFEFLQKSRVLIDLCAAPGGWLQVASQQMPVSSIIIGVDLAPIKTIPNIITIQDDITADTCRQALKRQLQSWKADVVLNDGAPNVGTNWYLDAYSQANLTLSALKLAVGFLRKGGWFITKIFRSKDYNALLWVFQQLFKKVSATKPQASRSESAEIFVVCRNYLAPDKLDPKFLDPKHVFAEIQTAFKVKKSDLGMPVKKTKALGYPDDKHILYNTVSATEFLKSTQHIVLLHNVNEIVFDDDRIFKHPFTTQEIKEICKDIKVIGKRELKVLLKWKKIMHHVLFENNKEETLADENMTENEVEDMKADDDDDDEEGEENDDKTEEDNIEAQLKEYELQKALELKRTKKKILKERKKLRDKIALKAELPKDRLHVETDQQLFKIDSIKTRIQLADFQAADERGLDDEDDDDSDLEMMSKYTTFSKDQPIPDYFSKDGQDENFESDSDARSLGSMEEYGNDDDNYGDIADEIAHGAPKSAEENPLLFDLDNNSPQKKRNKMMEMWFSKKVFCGIDDEDELDDQSEDDDDEDENNEEEINNNKNYENSEVNEDKEKSKNNNKADNARTTDSIRSLSSDSDNSDYSVEEEMMERSNSLKNKNKKNKSDKKDLSLDAEGLALGSLMIQSHKRKRDIIDDSWNRYTNNDDENLPAWFLEDEKKHFKRNVPVSKEMVQEYKKYMQEINARPLKKVLQAKMKKQRRVMKKMERARKKAEAIMDTEDMPDKERMQQVKAIYKKVYKDVNKKKEVKYVVSKKGGGYGQGQLQAVKKMSRSKKNKGNFKVVDKRMKKDEVKRKSVEKQIRKGKKVSKMQKKNVSKQNHRKIKKTAGMFKF